MSKFRIYMDHAATTPMHPEVVEAMLPFYQAQFGNPASLHGVGRQAKRALDQARQEIAEIIHAPAVETVLFTNGGTESNNLAIKGVAFGLKDKGRHIITSAIEHAAVLEPCAWLQTQGWEVTYLPVDGEGLIHPEDLERAIRPETVLVSLMHGNNEVGTLQPMARLARVAKVHGVLFHTDAVQTIGKLPMDVQAMQIDLLSCSGHKLYGPKGAGFLYASPAARAAMMPWLHGGGHEFGLRSGTENVPGIVGLAKALMLAEQTRSSHIQHLERLQAQLVDGIKQIAPQAVLNGPQSPYHRVPGIVNVSFPPVEGEALILRLDLAGICVSSGSACHSGALQGSHVLYAMGATEAVAKSTVRFSLGRANTTEDVEAVLAALPHVLEKVGYFRSHPTPATIS